MGTAFRDKASTRVVAIYIRNLFNCFQIESQKIASGNETPTEVISVELKLKKNEKMVRSNIYRRMTRSTISSGVVVNSSTTISSY